MLRVCYIVCLVATKFIRALLATKCVRRRSVMLKKKERPFSAGVQNACEFSHTPSKLHTVAILLRQRTCSHHLFPSIGYFTFHPLCNKPTKQDKQCLLGRVTNYYSYYFLRRHTCHSNISPFSIYIQMFSIPLFTVT